MPTHTELTRERELLTDLGLRPVTLWPPRCTLYRKDGSVAGKLPCDPYSRLLYMSRGLRPDVADGPSAGATPNPVPLLEPVVAFMDGKEVWEGTASELLSTLEPQGSGLPTDGTRLSKELFGLASQLAARGIGIERLPRGRQRGVRLARR